MASGRTPTPAARRSGRAREFWPATRAAGHDAPALPRAWRGAAGALGGHKWTWDGARSCVSKKLGLLVAIEAQALGDAKGVAKRDMDLATVVR